MRFLIFFLIYDFSLYGSESLHSTVSKVVALNKVFASHGVPKDLRVSIFCLTGLIGNTWKLDRVDDRPGDLLPGMSSVCPQLNNYSIHQYKLWDCRNDASNPLQLQCANNDAKLQLISWLQSKNRIMFKETHDGIVFPPDIIDCHGYKRIPFTCYDYFAYPARFEQFDRLLTTRKLVLNSDEDYMQLRTIAVRLLNSKLEASSNKECYFYYDLDRPSQFRNYAFVINAICTNQYLILDIRDLQLAPASGIWSYSLYKNSPPGDHRIEIFNIQSQLNRYETSGFDEVIILSIVPKVGQINLSDNKSVFSDFMLWSIEKDNTLVLKKFNTNDAGVRLRISGVDEAYNNNKDESLFLRFKPKLGCLPFTYAFCESVITIQKIIRMYNTIAKTYSI